MDVVAETSELLRSRFTASFDKLFKLEVARLNRGEHESLPRRNTDAVPTHHRGHARNRREASPGVVLLKLGTMAAHAEQSDLAPVGPALPEIETPQSTGGRRSTH